MTRRVSSPVFIGRKAELDRIEGLLAAAVCTGEGATVLISGEAGVGKTRFAAEITSRADVAGWTVLSGACDEFSAEARPFAALQEMSPAVREVLEREAPAELDRPGWRAIAQLSAGRATGELRPPTAGSVTHLVLDLFQRMARVRPLLVVIDDLHWADESSRLLFATLARGLQSAPALLVGCYRGNEVDRGHPLRPILAAVHHTGRPEQIDLQTFDREEASALAREITRSRRDEPDEIASLFERSGGNAFLLEELLATSAGALPLGVTDVVLARVDALGPDAIAVAEAASLDSSLPGAVLAAVAELPEERLEAATDLLAERGLLRIDSTGSTFRHALIREVIYGRIPAGHRTSLHRRAAEAFQRLDARKTGEAARHWHLADDPAQALAASVAAARGAYRIGAFPESADHYERALALWDTVPCPKEASGRSHATLVEQAATAMVNCRRQTRAAELIEGALDREGCTAEERATLYLGLGHAYRPAFEFQGWAKSRPAFRKAVECLDSSFTPAKRLEVLFLSAYEGAENYGMDSEALATLKEAEQLGAVATSPIDTLRLGLFRALVALVHGSPGAARLLDEARTISAPFPHLTVGQRLSILFGDHQWNATHGISRRDRLFEAGFSGIQGMEVEWMIARSLSRLGRWQEGLQRLTELTRIIGAEPVFATADLVACGWAAMMVRIGRVDDARSLVQRAAPLVVPAISCHSMGYATVRVELARLDRDRDASRLAVNTIIDDVQGHFIALSGEAVAFAIALEADFAFERPGADGEALALVDHWIARLESCLVEAPGRVRVDDFGTFLAQCHAERARLAGADTPEAWERIAETWEGRSLPYYAAYSHLRAASALLTIGLPAGKGARGRASAHLDAALATCREIGAVHLEADVERLRKVAGFRDARSRAITSQPSVVVPRPTLTARECDVLVLLARGDSNGRIAIVLGISVRTAGVHVSNIMHKLGATNRVEAAMRARNLGLLDRDR